MLQGKIFDSIIDLHIWRKKFNNLHLGLGFDEYKPREIYHYPEAYALWGQGYVKLFELMKEDEFLDLAQLSAKWLLENKNPGYNNYSWGLPWTWEQWRAPETLSYLSTTMFAGELFLPLYDITGFDQYLNVAESIAKWAMEENSGVRSEKGLMLYFANFPPLKFPIVNPIAKASGFFARLHSAAQKDDYRITASETARYVINTQNPDGSWYYSAKTARIDNVHTGYTLEGLWEYYNHTLDDSALKSALKGTAFCGENSLPV